MGIRKIPILLNENCERRQSLMDGMLTDLPSSSTHLATKHLATDLLGLRVSVLEVPIMVIIFLFTLILPVTLSFQLGPLRMTPGRIFLLVVLMPVALQLASGRIGRVILADWLILGYGLWTMLSLSVHHGGNVGMESGGILVVESIGPYLIARTQIRSLRQAIATLKFIVGVILVFALYTVPEAITGVNPLQGITGGGGIDKRMGLYRARGTFEHPILYGVFCASMIGVVWFGLRVNGERQSRRLLFLGGVTLSALMSVSSGVMAAISVQLLLIIWRYWTRVTQARWKLLIIVLFIGYVAVDILSNRSPITVLLHRLTFSAHTAYNRMIIWDWGFYQNALVHPVFGIGFNEWVRPSWMHSTSMDNFWLVQMVRYGMPAFLMLAVAVLTIMFGYGRLRLSGQLANMRMGWMVSMVGIIVAACTVHLWNASYVYFFFIIGLGAALRMLSVAKDTQGSILGRSHAL